LLFAQEVFHGPEAARKVAAMLWAMLAARPAPGWEPPPPWRPLEG